MDANNTPKFSMNTNQRRAFNALILLLGLAWVFLSADKSGMSTSGNIPAPQRGFLAPDFELQTPDGETVKLSDLRGQAVLVNLWATWCPPCREEMPAIERMYNEYKDRGFVVLAVNMTYQDEPQKIAPFISQYGLTFPILLDPNNRVGSVYRLRSLPSSFFIGRDGIITEVVIGGPMSEKLLRQRIETLLD